MTQHTPTPWIFYGEEDGDTGVITCEVLGPTEGVVAYVNDPSLGDDDVMIANAEFIVTAVNSHEELLEALEQAALELEEAANVLTNSLPSLASIYRVAAESKRAAIKSARGQQ